MFTEIVQILKRNSNYEIIKTSHKGKKSIFIKQQNPSRASERKETVKYLSPDYVLSWDPDYVITLNRFTSKLTTVLDEIVQTLKGNTEYEVVRVKYKNQDCVTLIHILSMK